jgi:hypothetical protein
VGFSRSSGLLSRLLLPVAACAAATLLGCAVPTESTTLAPGPDPVSLRVRPGVPRTGQPAEVVIESPSADSLVLQSANGVDRYWTNGSKLRVRLGSRFGDTTSTARFAVRHDGRLLDVLQRPVTVRSCRQGRCREFYQEIPLKLDERNRHSVSLTAGWSTVFARRSITGVNRTVLFTEALNSGIWTLQGEWTGQNWSGRGMAFYASDEHGGSLDVSRVVKHADGIQYGLAMHLGVTHDDWLAQVGSPALADRTGYEVGIGPSIMLRGVTASSQIGLYTNGNETLQVLSTRVSVNGNLTDVRQPVTITAEKTFAFGGGVLVSRRRDALESLTAAVHVLEDFAIKVGITSHRSAWPNEQPSNDLRGSETLFTLGGQYSLIW